MLDESARASLRVALTELRQALGSAAAYVVATRDTVALDGPDLSVDVRAFQLALDEGEPVRALEACGGPILDGFAPPPPYQWVSPPPGVAVGNDKPASGSFRVRFGANGTSRADVLSTSDIQVTLILSGGTFPPKPGETSALVTIQPFAPSKFAAPPSGLAVRGWCLRRTAAAPHTSRRGPGRPGARKPRLTRE